MRLTRYEITRPGMLVKTQVIKNDKVTPMPKSHRAGFGNYEIKRDNFLAPEVAPRQFIGFDELRKFNVEQFGQKSSWERTHSRNSLGSKSLTHLTHSGLTNTTDASVGESLMRKFSATLLLAEHNEPSTRL